MHVLENLIFVLALTVFSTSGDLCGKEIFYDDRYIDIEKFEIEEQGRAGEGKFLAHLKLNLKNCTRACCENEKCNVISYDNNEKDKIKKRCYLYECVPLKDCEGNLVSKAGLDTVFIDKPEQQSVSDDNSNINENSQDPNEPIYSKTKDQGVDLAVQDSDAGIASLKPTSTAPSPQSSSSPLSEFGVNNNSDAGPQLDSNENSEQQPPPLSSEKGILNNGTADSNEPINSGKLPTSSSASPSKAMSSASVAKTNKENLPSSAHTTTSITGTNSSSTSTSSTTSSSSTTSTTTTTTATPQSAKQQENENPQNTETNGTDNNDNEGISETNSSNTQVTTTTKTPTTIAPIPNSTRTSTTTTSATPESVMKPTTQAKQATATPSTTVQQNSESNTSTETISPKENNNAEGTQLENLFNGNKDGHPSHAWSAALIAALSFGILFFVSVLAIIAKRCFDGWQRRHYSRIDYLVNGMYN